MQRFLDTFDLSGGGGVGAVQQDTLPPTLDLPVGEKGAGDAAAYAA